MEEEEEEKEREQQEKKLKQRITYLIEKNKYILILDDEGCKMNEGEIMTLLNELMDQKRPKNSKVLITTRSSGSSEETGKTVIEVKSLSMAESLSLFQERAKTVISKIPETEQVHEAIYKKSRGLPAAIILHRISLRNGHWKELWRELSALRQLMVSQTYSAVGMTCCQAVSRKLQLVQQETLSQIWWHPL